MRLASAGSCRQPGQGSCPQTLTCSRIPPDPCYLPLGTAALPDGSFGASSEQAESPAHAARLHGGGPGESLQGWAPPDDASEALPDDLPFLQLDLLKPTNITGGCQPARRGSDGATGATMCRAVPAGVVVQGAGSSDAFVTTFLLQFSADGTRWHHYRNLTNGTTNAQVPLAAHATMSARVMVHMCVCTCMYTPLCLSVCPHQLFQGNQDATTPVVRLLGRMVQAQHVRILPQDFHNRIVLRAELLGCPTGTRDNGGQGGHPPPPVGALQLATSALSSSVSSPAWGCDSASDTGDAASDTYDAGDIDGASDTEPGPLCHGGVPVWERGMCPRRSPGSPL